MKNQDEVVRRAERHQSALRDCIERAKKLSEEADRRLSLGREIRKP